MPWQFNEADPVEAQQTLLTSMSRDVADMKRRLDSMQAGQPASASTPFTESTPAPSTQAVDEFLDAQSRRTPANYLRGSEHSVNNWTDPSAEYEEAGQAVRTPTGPVPKHAFENGGTIPYEEGLKYEGCPAGKTMVCIGSSSVEDFSETNCMQGDLLACSSDICESNQLRLKNIGWGLLGAADPADNRKFHKKCSFSKAIRRHENSGYDLEDRGDFERRCGTTLVGDTCTSDGPLKGITFFPDVFARH